MLLCEKFVPFFELLDPERSKQYKKIRYVILIGGRGGAKSHALGTWINSASFIKGFGVYFTRWTMKSAEKSIIPQFRAICETLGNETRFDFKQTQVINNQTGVVIDYSGLRPQSNQSSGDSKSLADKNIFVVEEAEDVQNFELFDKADNSIRTTKHKNLVILCLNQGHVSHWIYREFIENKRDDVMVIETTYLDNLKFLDDGFIKKAERVKERNLKRYNHIYLNQWQKDIEGALWLDKDISPYRITIDQFNALEIEETVIAYDPAVTDSDKPIMERTANTGRDPDEEGIVVMSKCTDKRIYLRRDKSCRGKRSAIAKRLCDLFHEFDARYIIIEKNNGGDWIPAMIKLIDPSVRCKTVTATKGKKLRAQPIQTIYEDGGVSHVGHYGELELEMTSWIPDSGMKSPNRLDALVWGATHLSSKPKPANPMAMVF